MFINNKTEAINKITESVRDLYTFKITVPLGNPNFSLVHTNQFLYTQLPTEVFELANMEDISKALDSSYSRFSDYENNRWYIESMTITNNGKDGNIEFELNPFATSMMNYRQNKLDYQKAWEDAQPKENSSSKTSNNSSDSGKAVGGEGKTIDELVEKIIKNEEDDYKKAKLIHDWLQKNRNYKFYLNSKTKSPAGALKKMQSGGINCADTSKLTASMFRSAGIECFIVHIPKRRKWGHYVTIFKYNGKLHCSDCTGKHPIDEYVTDVKSKNKFNGKKFWDRKCGKNPC